MKFGVLISALGCGLLFSACTTSQETSETPPQKTQAPQPYTDLGVLARTLGMDRSIRELGYEERMFDSCLYPVEGMSPCGPKNLIVAHFRVQCRDSDGTVNSVDPNAIYALQSDHVKWSLGPLAGITTTDFEGYGQVIALAERSMKRERFRLTTGGKFLVMTAEDITRVVAPKSWCKGR